MQEYSNKKCFEPIKDYIKEALGKEVNEIVQFFRENRGIKKGGEVSNSWKMSWSLERSLTEIEDNFLMPSA